jgi:Cu/Ag efflux pump CusA
MPGGERVPLAAVARVYQGAGPNTISRENAKRCIVVRVNTRGRDLAGVVTDIENALRENVELPKGYFITMGGQFEAQQEATRRIVWLSVLAIVVVFGVLYSNFRSLSLVSQILIALPTAFVGGTLALVLTGQNLSVAAMVGFISLGGIAARNGLLLVSTYLDLSREQGFSRQSLLQGSLSRLAPVLMTSLTTGLGLVPLVIGGQQPGKEILFPVATVILGGIITSTMCEFLLRPGMFWFLTSERSLTPQSES